LVVAADGRPTGIVTDRDRLGEIDGLREWIRSRKG
jgi:hypothetical protein